VETPLRQIGNMIRLSLGIQLSNCSAVPHVLGGYTYSGKLIGVF
jgi:hypothetical protein